VTRRAAATLLDRLGVAPADAVVMHSAFRGLSARGHRADEFVAGLVDYMAAGTLLMPTMSWRAVNPENPIFDELATPGITGILTETFRLGFATRRSLHPTHSVAARGRLADAFLATHHLDETPCGARSPWGLLDDFDAHVVLLGIGMERCTLVHHVEEMIAPEIYVKPPETRERYICRDRNGRELEMYARRHPKLPRNFWQFEDVLAAEGGVRYAEIEGVAARSFRAADMYRVIAAAMRRNPRIVIETPIPPQFQGLG
jgi:aminoglycoside 3-N-acetyltransferase